MKLQRFVLLFLLFLPLPTIQGCSPSAELIATNAIDPTGGLGREDYIALRQRTPTNADEKTKKSSEIPPIPRIPGDDSDVPMDSPLHKLVSITVTDSVPVRDVLMELVHKTGANLQLDPRVQGSVIFTAHDQPFEQVLKRICSIANLRYIADGSFIYIKPDEAYQKTYRLDYLSLARKTSSDTSIATNVFDVDVIGNNSNGTTSNRNSNSTDNNSTAKVSGVSDADFWSETEKSLAQILGSGERRTNGKNNYSINKQAGIVTVYGDQKQQDSVAAYFSELRKKASAQVLIDARIIEVELNEDYQSGIDWSGAFKHAFGASANFGTQALPKENGFFTAAVTGNNFGGMINLVQTFGTTRVLSAPRVTVLNNQTAVMKVATNQVYEISTGKIISQP